MYLYKTNQILFTAPITVNIYKIKKLLKLRFLNELIEWNINKLVIWVVRTSV